MASLLPSVNTDAAYMGVHAINVYVRDQERSLKFYIDKLGFQIAFDGHQESGERLVAVAPPDGTAVLALIQPDPSSRQYRLIGRSMHVVLVPDEVLGRYREWVGRGVRFSTTPGPVLAGLCPWPLAQRRWLA